MSPKVTSLITVLFFNTLYLRSNKFFLREIQIHSNCTKKTLKIKLDQEGSC